MTKEFGANGTKTLALRGVDLDVYDGQLTLLVGPSGCGKTTLISIIAGLLNPTQGSVAVLGTDLAKLSGRRLVEFRAKNIGFVFQQYNLLPALSAVENAAVPLIITGWSRAKAVAKAPRHAGRRSDWDTGPTAFRRNCRAASSSAWRSRGP